MRERLGALGPLVYLGGLVIVSCFLLFASSANAQEYAQFGLNSRFGPHLACSNSVDFISKVRTEYADAGWGADDWVPATVMLPVTTDAAYIRAVLEAMTRENANPKLWPIIRLDGSPHGDRISSEEIDGFVARLERLEGLENLEGKTIFIEFGNETNFEKEWGGTVNAGDYKGQLEYFAEKIRTLRQAQDIKFSTLNGALNQTARTGAGIQEAISYWEEGNLGSVNLDGYAFNNYYIPGAEDAAYYGDGRDRGRVARDGWRVIRQNYRADESKPVFLLEFGLDPQFAPDSRKGAVADDYLQEQVGGGLGDVSGVAAITPLMCIDAGCDRIDTAVFGADGTTEWLESDGEGNCGGKREPAGGCEGEVGDRDDEGAKDDNKCGDWSGCPETLREQGLCGAGGEQRAQTETIDTNLTDAKDGRSLYLDGGGESGEILGVREDLIDALCGLPVVDILCQWARHGDKIQGYKDPAQIREKNPDIEVPEPPAEPVSAEQVRLLQNEGFGERVAGALRGLIGHFVSDPETGYLQTYLPSETLHGEAGVLTAGDEDPLNVHNLVAGCGGGQGGILIPHGLCDKVAVAPPGEGEEPAPTFPPGGEIGHCPAGPPPHCSVEVLMPYFGNDRTKAENASQICGVESNGNPFALNDGCLYGSSVDYSVGLFQINLLAHCPGAFSDYTWDPPSCTIGNPAKLKECKSRLFDPVANIQEAVRISGGGTNWSAWAAADVCGIQ